MTERIEISGSREEALKQQAPGGCACGGHDEDLPQLEVQAIPHAVRHAAIFGALDSLRQAGAVDNPFWPSCAARSRPEVYLEEGPDVWKLKFVRN